MEDTSIKKSTDAYLRRKFPLAVPVLLLAIALVLYIAIHFQVADLIQTFFFLLIIPSIFYIALIESRFRSELIRGFARENNFHPELRLPVPAEPFCLFTTGTPGHFLTDCFTGTIQGNPFTFFLYQLRKRAGRNTVAYSYHGIVVELPKSLPHIIVDAKKTEGTFLTEQYGKQHLVKLEGDFHKQFNVLVPSAVKPIAWRFLTPDFMHRLMQQDIVYDVEIIGNKMVMYHNSVIDKPLQLAEIMESTHMVITEIMKKLSILQPETSAPHIMHRGPLARAIGSSTPLNLVFLFLLIVYAALIGWSYYITL